MTTPYGSPVPPSDLRRELAGILLVLIGLLGVAFWLYRFDERWCGIAVSVYLVAAGLLLGRSRNNTTT
jgi:hypothetical protein